MATKTIAWTTGSGNITLTYTGQGNGSISVSSTENDTFDDRSQSINIVTTAGSPEKAVSILIKQHGKKYVVGDVFNFSYTGSVQQVTLPKGKYKLQCWGAQGGTSYGSSSGAGSKGGYSEGVITLTETTTFYVFVGGQGSRGSSTSLVNGGWNGGGGSVGYSAYNSGGTNGYSYPACGGGATDISTVTSSMSYSSGRTNRSSASLLARCIVAGGGAGGSYRYTTVQSTSTSTETVLSNSYVYLYYYASAQGLGYYLYGYLLWSSPISGKAGETYTISYTLNNTSKSVWYCGFYDENGNNLNTSSITLTSNKTLIVGAFAKDSQSYNDDSGYFLITVKKTTSTTTTSNSSGYSNKSQQGGGTSGKGQYPGTQSSAGSGGGFGYGANQETTNYRYCSGAGGGGWYGGGNSYSDSSTSYVNYSGGGSGFVNTSANASYRPSGYTGLQLDSGSTKDGSTSFESTSGGTETGHSGNGYARITVLEQ